MAFALVLTMAQCKKNEETNQDEIVTISLDVKYNNGSKVDVNTMIGTVNFETGDKVYVGSGGKYVGFLTHNGTYFVGNITNPTEGQPLQFYFLGNVTPNETLTAGTTEECSVIISDQTEHLPVISTAASNENYVSGVTAYTGHLLNKCALVKFNVTTPSNSPICITGMKNKVTVDFSENIVTPSMDGEGIFKLSAGAGENVEKWAILLPQEALEEGLEGSVYSEDGSYTGIRPTISNILENDYLTNGIAVTVNTVPVAGVPEGAINGLFTINENGDQVYFSQGNLQYQASTNIWHFAENQWDYVGTDNANISQTYSGWIDLFGWGTSGYNHGASCYQPWSTSVIYDSYLIYGISIYNLYDQTGQADWGYNTILNGGNQENYGWRTLTNSDWSYMFYNRTDAASKRGYGKVNGVNGLILLPDDWTLPEGLSFTSGGSEWINVYIDDQWAQMEANGAVFFPAAGSRIGTSLHYVDSNGYYWLSTRYDGPDACNVYFSSGFSYLQTSNLCLGYSVRLVRNVE